MKHIYKAIGLFILFILSILFFGRMIPEISVATTAATSMQHSTFPLVYLQTGEFTINTLHGYSSELGSGKVRESITPIDAKKKLTVKIQQNESKIKKLNFQLRDIANKKNIEENTLTAFETKKTYRTAVIKFSVALESSKEYGLQITLTTNLSKKIHFYTRIKYYADDCFLKQKLEFVKNFHKATFSKKTDFNIAPYLEANTNANSSLANVTINSSLDMITWKKLNPKKITKPVPMIHELNIATAAISQTYYVTMKTSAGTETYYVSEYYRVRYADNRIYLLAFNRRMEAFFNPSFVSMKKSEFKIGITNAEDIDILSSDSNKKVAFVRNGNLYHYDLEKNKLTIIFSFSEGSSDYLRDFYMQHNIKILKIDDDGNISFMLYGYMNGGDYEGRVGIILYDYTSKENRITERVYIPLSTTYQQLKEDIGNYSYFNNRDIFYFSFNDKVYAYNISSKKYEILTEHASKDHFSMLKKAGCFIWSKTKENSSDKISDNIQILDLETSKYLSVKAAKNEGIIVLGTIDSNIVYGFVRKRDIFETSTGEIITPAYKLFISDCKGNILREYRNPNRYVTSAVVEDNVIRLERMKKSNGKFVDTSGDTIMNQKSVETKSVKLTTRITQKFLTEYYLSLPAGFILQDIPDITATKQMMVTENTTLHLSDEEVRNSVKYYIYANGGISSSTDDIALSIQMADEQMGTVMDSDSHIIWERGGKFLSKELSGITYPNDGSSSLKACTQMLLQAAQITTTTSELKGKSPLSMLKRYIDLPVNLTGCTVDEILYFVSSSKPVIAMTGNNSGVLIMSYTTANVSWMDPATMKKRTMSIHSAEEYFKKLGYKFISYVAN